MDPGTIDRGFTVYVENAFQKIAMYIKKLRKAGNELNEHRAR
jgi:hypothetical protein